jgi:polyphosphate:AMP phosphotransferase
MFETAELGRKVDKKIYKDRVPPLREELLRLQEEIRQRGANQVILLFAGVDGGGKGETVNLLNEWLDPRWMMTNAYAPPDEIERQRPAFWRYWRDLPSRGHIGMFLSAWYSQPILDRVYDRSTPHEFDVRLERILSYETALADDGATIVKFWMHLSHSGQERRLKNLEQDPLTQARVTERDWENWKRYDRFIEAAEHVISRTHTGKTPWVIVEGEDACYRSLTVGDTIRDTFLRLLRGSAQGSGSTATIQDLNKTAKKNPRNKSAKKEPRDSAEHINVLTHLDMTKAVSKQDYLKELRNLQAEIHLLHLQARHKGVATLLLFEGPDAAGKGGAIRRINAALEARNYQVHGVAKPTEDELAQHYLWRFWRNIPRDGYMAIYDRSWYGRVLVERVEGLASEEEWRRAYAEINDFEHQLIEHGIILVKYWIHITKDEQLKRFKLRERTPHKRWKLTEDDWRNRKRWELYELSVHDMVQYTSTDKTPWTLVEGNDKRYARIKVLQTLRDRWANVLGQTTAPPARIISSESRRR